MNSDTFHVCRPGPEGPYKNENVSKHIFLKKFQHLEEVVPYKW